MKVVSLDTDEAQRLDLYFKVNRTFDVQVNIGQQPLTGSTFQLDVCDDAGTVVLRFTPASGLTVTGRQVRLLKSATDMAIPTGVYHYDLVQITGTTVNNLLYGNAIAQPSYTRP